MRTLTKASVVALAVAALALAGTNILTKSAQPRFALTAANGFTVTSTITPYPSCSGSAALLYPGTTRCLIYSVYNPLSVPITVTSISISAVSLVTSSTNTAYPPCTTSDFDLSHATFSGSLNVPAKTTNTVSEQIALAENGDEDNCRNATFTFTYAGTATYVEAYATSTAVTSSHNPSNIGQAVTYTATVTASYNPSSQDPPPNNPTGTVTFKDGSVTICSNVAVVSGAGLTSTATCSPPAYIGNGTHSIAAAYTNADGNFSNSSGSFTQTVSATAPSQCTGSYSNTIVGTPSQTTVTGTNGNDLIFAFGANYSVNGENGSDCLDAGDGNNTLTDGNGSDTVVAGNGNDQVTVGNGNDAITLGNGTDKVVVGNGTDTVTIGNGNSSSITGGNNPDTITLGTGSSNAVTIGNGNNVVTVHGGSHDTVVVGNGNNTISLGSGTNNTFKGGSGHNVCHVPSPGAAALSDTITNCTVVTP
jgi:hypothetical protein